MDLTMDTKYNLVIVAPRSGKTSITPLFMPIMCLDGAGHVWDTDCYHVNLSLEAMRDETCYRNINPNHWTHS